MEETRTGLFRRKTHYAQRLRQRMTPAETILWNELRSRRCGGHKFRRQVPIEHFVVDFLCIEHKLVIEVDGGIHQKQQEYDQERETIIQERGYRIVRFNNNDVIHRLPTVLEAIKQLLPSPS